MDIRPIRRVVTGHDAQGHAVVVMDGPAANVLHRPDRPRVALTDLWATSEKPAARMDGDPVDRPVVLHPPPAGTVFRIIQFDPEDPGALAHADGTAAFAAMGAAGTVVAGARHPYMHRTDTVDYAVVLQGSITMLQRRRCRGPERDQPRVGQPRAHAVPDGFRAHRRAQ
jgi:hypothetical protein